jgi:arginine decarboxylase
MPDSWAIDQLFPICPIHRLAEEPTRRGIMADITCDSDGKVDNFVDKRIELHELRSGEPYYLGVFLLGAYQEILGDLHNLLGDTHAVHVSYNPLGGSIDGIASGEAPPPGVDGAGAHDFLGKWSIDEVIEGDTVKEVLSYVQYDDQDMRRAMRRDIERAIKANRITVAEGKSLLAFYESGLDGYTYLEE